MSQEAPEWKAYEINILHSPIKSHIHWLILTPMTYPIYISKCSRDQIQIYTKSNLFKEIENKP